MKRRIQIFVIMVTLLCLGTAEVNALILNDGGVHTVDWIIDEPVSVEDSSGSDFTTLNLVDGGEIVSWVNVFDYSQFNMSGGSIGFELFTYEYSQATITGGSIANDLFAFDESHVFVSGGTIADEIDVRDISQVTISGSDFGIDGVPVDYGKITTGSIDEFGRLTGTLTGILQTGDTLNNVFYIEPDASIFLVPEPATALMFGIGIFWFIKKRRS